jgi:lipoprotein-anchoring transpeptidase ErfK/SrfK
VTYAEHPPQDWQAALAAAKQALSTGDRKEARRMARLAARLAPTKEAPWLFLAAVSEPRPGLAYAARALEINPDSQPARKAIRWLVRRIPQSLRPRKSNRPRLPTDLAVQLTPTPALTARRWVSARTWVPLIVALAGIAIWLGIQPAFARQGQAGPMPVAKASFTPTATSTPTETPTPTPTPTPEPTSTPTPTPTRTPRPNLSWDFSTNPADLANEGRWIDVDLGRQTVTAYEGTTPVQSFLVSSGVAAHPTVTGQFRIYVKLRATTMAGPGYFLPAVPFTMYFYKGYSLHGTYWHHNFGHPMSHGCVNMYTPDAEWLFNFATVGTLVNVHP